MTYEEFGASWPVRSGDPFTDRMNSLPKFVASATLDEPLEWNAMLLAGDVVHEVRKRTQQPGHDLLIYGSSTLVNTLMEHSLIDVYRLMLYPLALGSGKRLFRERGTKTMLELADAKTTSTGVAVLTYEAAGTDTGGSAARGEK